MFGNADCVKSLLARGANKEALLQASAGRLNKLVMGSAETFINQCSLPPLAPTGCHGSISRIVAVQFIDCSDLQFIGSTPEWTFKKDTLVDMGSHNSLLWAVKEGRTSCAWSFLIKGGDVETKDGVRFAKDHFLGQSFHSCHHECRMEAQSLNPLQLVAMCRLFICCWTREQTWRSKIK